MTPRVPAGGKPQPAKSTVVPESALLPASSLALDISLRSVAIILLRRRWLIISSTLLCFVIFGGINYTPERLYSSTVTFSPKRHATPLRAASILAQLGIGGAPPANDLHLVDLVKSHEVLAATAASSYSFRTDTGRIAGRFTEIYGIRNQTPELTRFYGISILNSNVESTPRGPYLIKVSVATRYPELSPMVAARLVQELNRINLDVRKQSAAQEKDFIQARLEDANLRLREAEDRLQMFETTNRSFSMSSVLAFEADRLKRQVLMRQYLYTSLAKALDNARIAEVQNSPVLNVVERPEIPLKADRPKWVEKATMGAVFGFFLGIVLSFFHAFFAGETYPVTGEAAEYRKLRRSLGRDIRQFLQPLGRLLPIGRR